MRPAGSGKTPAHHENFMPAMFTNVLSHLHSFSEYSQRIHSLTYRHHIMALASKWATDPELVKKAQEQDLEHKAITVKKGQPLVSKWASASDDSTTSPNPEPTINPEDAERMRVIKERQLAKRKAADEKKARDLAEAEAKNRPDETTQPNDLVARLGVLTIEPVTRESSVPRVTSPKKLHRAKAHKQQQKTVVAEDQWEDDVGAEKIAPTKAAQSFASRLGISIGGEQSKARAGKVKKNNEDIRNQRELERQRIREKKANNATEWDTGKPGTKVDHSLKRDISKEHKQKKEPMSKANLDAEMKMLDDIATGKIEMDWADFD